jgi:hypothetical protein
MTQRVSRPKPATAELQALFLKMAPLIATHARICFQDLDPESREEHIAEVLANAFCAFLRLAQLNRLSVAYPSALARFGVAQVKSGRKVGTKMNVNDVASELCQRQKGVVMERLDKFDADENAWQEVLVADRKANDPADLAASRIDVPAWLGTLSRRNRRIAMKLAVGEQTSRVARMFGLTEGRVSQLRKEFKAGWERFHGETGAAAVPA